MRPERSTNLMAGINSGFQQMQQIPEPDTAMRRVRARAAAADRARAPARSPTHPRPHRYALNLIIATDGMPTPCSGTSARGRDGYLLSRR